MAGLAFERVKFFDDVVAIAHGCGLLELRLDGRPTGPT
jgi:hypothetical protein